MTVLKISILIAGICFILLFSLLFFCKFAPTKRVKIFKLIGKGDYFKGVDVFSILIKSLIIIGIITLILCVFVCFCNGIINNFVIWKN